MYSSQRALSFLPELKRNKFARDICTPQSHPQKMVLVAVDAELQSLSNIYLYYVTDGSPTILIGWEAMQQKSN